MNCVCLPAMCVSAFPGSRGYGLRVLGLIFAFWPIFTAPFALQAPERCPTYVFTILIHRLQRRIGLSARL